MAKTYMYGDVAITWFGHASFLLESKGEAVYIDNYALPDSAGRKATIIIHTHGHYDHCADCSKIADAKTVYAGMCRHARDLIGNRLRIRNVEIEFVEAYNLDKQFHPRGQGCGVIVTLGGARIYHAGDTDLIPEMKQHRCDVALLPIGGTFTMNEKEAAEAVKAINPKVAIPMHYDYIPRTRADPTYFKKLVEGNFSSTKIAILG